jgi:hypothetical protein
MENKQTELLRKAEADRVYGNICEDTLTADQALVSIYPPIKVIPETDQIVIKKMKQKAYMIELQEQMNVKREAA